MPCRYGALPADRLKVEFVEADIEIGFSLVDMAEIEWTQGHAADTSRLLHDADEIFEDVGKRLQRFNADESAHFLPLVGELRRALDIAHTRYH